MEKRVKKSYICRNVENYNINESFASTHKPQVGDVAIFQVLGIGKHSNIQGSEKRNISIYTGDYIMAAFGTRYATEQFEGYVPRQPMEVYHILGAGGTVGIIESMHSKFSDIGPTSLRMIGYAVNSGGQIINTKSIHNGQMIPYDRMMKPKAKVILSIGSSMDSGKTTTAAHLIRGLKNAGKKAGFIKLTGTVFTKDCDLNFDNGADVVSDFGDMGFPSTYMCSEEELLNLYATLLVKINADELDYVVMEIADGIYQRETEMLLINEQFMSGIHAVVFSAGDSLSAVQGVSMLEEINIKPVALCGLFTASPLLMDEVKAKINLPVLTLEHLVNSHLLKLLKKETIMS
jgi:Domain of unknown function (DUF1611_C) P-loop domain